MWKRPCLFCIVAILYAFIIAVPVMAQSDASELRIVKVDLSQFPDIKVMLVAVDSENAVINDLSDLTLEEDGRSITEFDIEQFDAGTELVFVIDADSNINRRDDNSGLSRREKVRDSIVRFANLFMDPTQADRVSIVVPDGGGQFLDEPDMMFPTQVINTINFYQPEELGDTDLNGMLMMALEQAKGNREEGRNQAIVLFSEAGNLDEKLDFDSLVAGAQESDVTFYGAILGARADEDEIENVSRLTDPTGGQLLHMPTEDGADPLYEAIIEHSNQHLVSYRSRIDSAGDHTLRAVLGSAADETMFEQNIQPPSVTIAIDNSQPIRRVANSPDVPLEEMEPSQQPLVATVDWPDSNPRSVVSAFMLVNTDEVSLDDAVLDDTGRLTFDWDISSLDEGVYVLQVHVEDELGLEGASEPLPMRILVDRPKPLATATTVATLVPAEPAEDEDTGLILGLPVPVLVIIGGGLLFMVLVVVLVAGVVLGRRRSSEPAPEPVSPPVPYAAPPVAQSPPARAPAQPPAARVSPPPQPPGHDPSVTYVMPPEFALDEFAGAYLEPLENATDHPTLIPVAGDNVALGRDPKRTDITFMDRSVSRLHARIMESHGSYRLYDEGSASGTYVNYSRIGLSPCILNDKDDIHFGRVHLRFHLAAGGRNQPKDDTEIFDSTNDAGEDTQIY